MIVRATTLVVIACVVSAMMSAQIGGKPATGNPTPGTEQPAPPNVADRVTFVGCLQPVARAATLTDSNAPSDSRFELTKATSADTKTPSKTYRLEGIESQFSPFVGSKVEITGEIKTAGANPPTLLVEFVQRIASKCS